MILVNGPQEFVLVNNLYLTRCILDYTLLLVDKRFFRKVWYRFTIHKLFASFCTLILGTTDDDS